MNTEKIILDKTQLLEIKSLINKGKQDFIIFYILQQLFPINVKLDKPNEAVNKLEKRFEPFSNDIIDYTNACKEIDKFFNLNLIQRLTYFQKLLLDELNNKKQKPGGEKPEKDNNTKPIKINQKQIIDTSFKSDLSDEQLMKIHKYLIDEEIIDRETKQNFFIFIFRNQQVEKPIKWVLKGKNSLINKKALLDFFRVLAKFKFIPEEEGSTVKSNNGCLFEKIELCFRDENGEKIKFNPSNRSGNSVYYYDFENLIKSFSEHS